MYSVYILYSEKFDKYYIGQTSDLAKRLNRHNAGKSLYTKPYRPWNLVYSKSFNSRTEAVQQERYLKSLKDKRLISELVNRIPV